MLKLNLKFFFFVCMFSTLNFAFSNEFAGIGAGLKMSEGTGAAIVIDVLPNSPAFKAGIQKGDMIYKVDDVNIQFKDIAEVVAMIKGPVGTSVKLYIRNQSETKEILIAREKVQISDPTSEPADGAYWSQYIRNGVINLAGLNNAFNKKDFDYFDWEELEKTHLFRVKDTRYTSPDEKVVIEKDYETGRFLRAITYRIQTLDDLKYFGFPVVKINYDNLVENFGEEYVTTRGDYECIVSPGESTKADNQIDCRIEMTYDGSEIVSIRFKPFFPEKIQIDQPLGIMTGGCAQGDCQNGDGIFVWAEGYCFVGSFQNGLPWTGKVYFRHSTNVKTEISSGKSIRGSLPSSLL